MRMRRMLFTPKGLDRSAQGRRASGYPGIRSRRRRSTPKGQGFRGDAAVSLYFILTGFTEFPERTTRMLPAAFLPFIQKRPIGVMARATVERFLAPEHLDTLFRQTATQQY